MYKPDPNCPLIAAFLLWYTSQMRKTFSPHMFISVKMIFRQKEE